eukprot:9894158-Lingulodinium_polyedra.AAC.1
MADLAVRLVPVAPCSSIQLERVTLFTDGSDDPSADTTGRKPSESKDASGPVWAFAAVGEA